MYPAVRGSSDIWQYRGLHEVQLAQQCQPNQHSLSPTGPLAPDTRSSLSRCHCYNVALLSLRLGRMTVNASFEDEEGAHFAHIWEGANVHLYLFNCMTINKCKKTLNSFGFGLFWFVCFFLCQHSRLLLFMCGKERTPCPDRLVSVTPTQTQSLNTMSEGEKKKRRRRMKRNCTHKKNQTLCC